MTQDIVGRLRNNRWPIDIEAAAEITALRAEVERQRQEKGALNEALNHVIDRTEAERDEATAQLASNSNALNIAAQIKHEASMTTSGFGLARLLRELDEALQLCTLPDRARDMLEVNGLAEKAAPMLERLAHYEGDINQPAKALAEQIRAAVAKLNARGE